MDIPWPVIIVVALVGNAWVLYDWWKNGSNPFKFDWSMWSPAEPAAKRSKNPFAGITEDEVLALQPPSSVHEGEPWDKYWRTHLKFGVATLSDCFSDDRALVSAMHARGFTTVLCVGAGCSMEPYALAEAGLTVTVLDISPLVASTMAGASLAPEGLDYYLDPSQRRPGGRVEFVVGDVMDPSLCPGPYDLVVERRTLQLFGDERAAAVDAIAARMTPNGMFFTHCHDGAWRPGRDRVHYVEPYLAPAGFSTGSLQSERWSTDGRTAFTFVSTG